MRMNAKTASEGSVFRDFSQQSEAFIRYHQDLIWWELNPGPHPPPNASSKAARFNHLAAFYLVIHEFIGQIKPAKTIAGQV